MVCARSVSFMQERICEGKKERKREMSCVVYGDASLRSRSTDNLNAV